MPFLVTLPDFSAADGPDGPVRPEFQHHPGDPGWQFHHGPHDSTWSAGLHNLANSFGGQIFVVLIIVVCAAAIAFAVRHRREWVLGLNPAATCLAFGSLAAIGVSTLTARSNAWAHGVVQLVPLHTLRSELHQPVDLLIYVGGNVALFMPLGCFVYLALGPRALGGRLPAGRLVISTLTCAVVSVGVEILQLGIWSRSSDVDDVLTNTAGGLIGALVGYVVLRLFRHWSAGPAPEREPDYAVGSRAS